MLRRLRGADGGESRISMKKLSLSWLMIGLVSFIFLPWHMTEDGFLDAAWIVDGLPSTGLFQMLAGQWWHLPALLTFIIGIVLQLTIPNPVVRAKATLLSSSIGLLLIAVQGLIIVRAGPRLFEMLLTGETIIAGQPGMGLGAGLVALSLLLLSQPQLLNLAKVKAMLSSLVQSG